MHRFQLSTTLCYGPDALAELSELSGRRGFFVTDGFMVNTALMARVRRLPRVLLAASLLVVLGAVAGSHGGWRF